MIKYIESFKDSINEAINFTEWFKYSEVIGTEKKDDTENPEGSEKAPDDKLPSEIEEQKFGYKETAENILNLFGLDPENYDDADEANENKIIISQTLDSGDESVKFFKKLGDLSKDITKEQIGSKPEGKIVDTLKMKDFTEHFTLFDYENHRFIIIDLLQSSGGSNSIISIKEKDKDYFDKLSNEMVGRNDSGDPVHKDKDRADAEQEIRDSHDMNKTHNRQYTR